MLPLPSSIFDLKSWYVTLPTGKAGHPDTVRQPSLDSYTDKNFTVTPEGDAIVFTGPCDGVTTVNSHYPRSELREMKGDALAGWSFVDVSELVYTAAVLHLPEHKPEVVIGQIHDDKDDVVMVKCAGKTITCSYKGTTVKTLDSNYTLGQKFTVKILAAAGVISVFYNDMATAAYTTTTKEKKAVNYFKVGCYTQSNAVHGAMPGEYAQTAVYSATVRHAAPVQPEPAKPPAPQQPGLKQKLAEGIMEVLNRLIL